MTSHQYLWHGATALNTLSEVPAESDGLLNRIMLMNTEPTTASPEQGNRTTAEPSAQDTKSARCALTSTSPHVAGSSESVSGIEADPNAFAASDSPSYTEPPTDDQSFFPRNKAIAETGKSDNKESIDEDGDANNAEL